MADSEKTTGAKKALTAAESKALDLAAQFEKDGFLNLSPEPRYWNVEGADPLLCVVLARHSQKQKGKNGTSVGYYSCVAMNDGKNGDYIDTESGEVITPPPWQPGDILRIGARHQIDDAFGYAGKNKVVGRKAIVALIPIEKVKTHSGNTVWRFKIMARRMSPSEEKRFTSFQLGEFGALSDE